MKAIGLEQSTDHFDAVFDRLDLENRGLLNYNELPTLLRLAATRRVGASDGAQTSAASCSRMAPTGCQASAQHAEARAEAARREAKSFDAVRRGAEGEARRWQVEAEASALYESATRAARRQHEEARRQHNLDTTAQQDRLELLTYEVEEGRQREEDLLKRLEAVERREADRDAESAARLLELARAEEESRRAEEARKAALWAAQEVAKDNHHRFAQQEEDAVRLATEDAVQQLALEARRLAAASEEARRVAAQQDESRRHAEKHDEERMVFDRQQEEQLRIEIIAGWQHAAQLEAAWRRSVAEGISLVQQHQLYSEWQHQLHQVTIRDLAWRETWEKAWPSLPLPQHISPLHVPLPAAPAPSLIRSCALGSTLVPSCTPTQPFACWGSTAAYQPPTVSSPLLGAMPPLFPHAMAVASATTKQHPLPSVSQTLSASSTSPSFAPGAPAEARNASNALATGEQLQRLIDAADAAAERYKSIRENGATHMHPPNGRSSAPSLDSVNASSQPLISGGRGSGFAEPRLSPSSSPDAVASLNARFDALQSQLQRLQIASSAGVASPAWRETARQLESEFRGAMGRTSFIGKQNEIRERAYGRYASQGVIDDLMRHNEILREDCAALRADRQSLESELNTQRTRVAEARAEAEVDRVGAAHQSAELSRQLYGAEAERARLCKLLDGQVAVVSNRMALTPLSSLSGQTKDRAETTELIGSIS